MGLGKGSEFEMPQEMMGEEGIEQKRGEIFKDYKKKLDFQGLFTLISDQICIPWRY